MVFFSECPEPPVISCEPLYHISSKDGGPKLALHIKYCEDDGSSCNTQLSLGEHSSTPNLNSSSNTAETTEIENTNLT